jgi:hypothetical protein
MSSTPNDLYLNYIALADLEANVNLCRKTAASSFGIYPGDIHKTLLRNDAKLFRRKLKNLNQNWVSSRGNERNWFSSKILPEPQNRIYHFIRDDSYTVCVRLEDVNTISITYMGTNSTIDVITDLLAVLEVWDSSVNQTVKVHMGFKASYKASRDKVVEGIKKMSCNMTISHLQFFGHSKGGAEATLAAYDLSQCMDLGLPKYFQVSLLTFGQPHVGNTAFVKDFQARIPKGRIGIFACFVNDLDPVPKILDGVNLVQSEENKYMHHCAEHSLDLDLDIGCIFFSIMDEKLLSMPFNWQKHFHGSWVYIYHLELILQGKRIAVDQAEYILAIAAPPFFIRRGCGCQNRSSATHCSGCCYFNYS